MRVCVTAKQNAALKGIKHSAQGHYVHGTAWRIREVPDADPRRSRYLPRSVGPLQVLVIECPGERLPGEIMLALTSAVDSGTLRIVDVTFIHKDRGGHVSSYELAELEEYELIDYDVVDETCGLLSVGDIASIGQRVSHDATAVLMVVEHAWTAGLKRPVLDANGRIVVHERVPVEVAIAALDRWGSQGRCIA